MNESICSDGDLCEEKDVKSVHIIVWALAFFPIPIVGEIFAMKLSNYFVDKYEAHCDYSSIESGRIESVMSKWLIIRGFSYLTTCAIAVCGIIMNFSSLIAIN